MTSPSAKPDPPGERSGGLLLEKVKKELERYEHPLFRFSPQVSGSGLMLAIDLREGVGLEHHYEITLHEREIENPSSPGRSRSSFTTAGTISSW